jgi:GNAT superfamily N-acetyltransferase
MKPQLRQPQIADASAISALVQAGFNEFVAADWEPQAQQVFMEQSSVERFVSLIPEAAFTAVAEIEDRIVGFVLLAQPAVLSFLFVEAAVHKRGIARLLWEAARSHVEAAHPAVKTVELNSSPHAVGAYKALGFYPISEPFRKGGCLATRMACWLPGRTPENQENAA